jgi:hypothetical protein
MSVFLSSCGDDNSTTPNVTTGYKFTCVVNGGGYTNETITYDKTFAAIYVPQVDVTGCSFTDGTNNTAVVNFKGTSKGTFTIDATDSDNTNTVLINLVGTNTMFQIMNGTLKVTAHGNVGSDVAGTFSGTGKVYKNGQISDITVTNGYFKAKRLN